MFFKSKKRQSPNAIYYCVSYLSPYFLLYIKCPKVAFWQLARNQDEPQRVVDGTSEQRVHPVLVFSSRSEAEDYATELGLIPRKVHFGVSGLFSLWHNVDQFEAVTMPEESIQVQKTLSVTPVVYEKPSAQINSVHTLPFVDRRRSS